MADIWDHQACRWVQWGCLASAMGILASILFWPVLTRASNPAQLCDQAAQNAARRHDVPLDVMRAVALVETGQSRNGRLEPWPWAINTGGPGHWPPSRQAALDLARATIEKGQRNVDLGCFQINYRWHGQNFASLDDMIAPETNADYAARLLSEHKARHGTWDAAAGAYHSATPAHANRYIARFRAMRDRSDTTVATKTTPPNDPPNEPAVRSQRDNTFTLLQPAGEQRLGSLVPMDSAQASRPLIQFGAVTR